MANPSYRAVTSMLGQILSSVRLDSTAWVAVYTVPDATTVKITRGTVCNTSGSPTNFSLGLLKSGDTNDGTHTVVLAEPVIAGDTVLLQDYLDGVMLASGESVWMESSHANALDVVLSGVVSSIRSTSGYGNGGYGTSPYGF